MAGERTSRIPRLSADTWGTIFGLAYLVVMTNVMLLVATFPLVVLLATTDPSRSWPALAVAAVLAVPALPAAFSVFSRFTDERSTEIARTFARAWWRTLRRSLAVGALAVGVVVVLAEDAAAMWGTRLGAVVLPALIVLALLACSTALLALVASIERPDARLRDVLKASLYLGVRRWYLTLGSFFILALLAGLFVEQPALAIGLASTPLLYAVWGNSRYTLRPVLPVGAALAV